MYNIEFLKNGEIDVKVSRIVLTNISNEYIKSPLSHKIHFCNCVSF